MKVTPWNIAKFWARLMFPPSPTHHLRERLSLRGDPPWEPWLHCAVWLSVWLIVVTDLPPENSDWTWIILGLTSPMLGFFSVWVLANGASKGWAKYVAMWTRMVADAGLAITIVAYQIAQWEDQCHPVIENAIMGFSAWYMLTLVVRDIRLIVEVERLADYLHKTRGADVLAWQIVDSATTSDASLLELLEQSRNVRKHQPPHNN